MSDSEEPSGSEGEEEEEVEEAGSEEEEAEEEEEPEERSAKNVNRTCSSALDLHYKVVDLGVTCNFVVEVECSF